MTKYSLLGSARAASSNCLTALFVLIVPLIADPGGIMGQGSRVAAGHAGRQIIRQQVIGLCRRRPRRLPGADLAGAGCRMEAVEAQPGQDRAGQPASRIRIG